MVIIGKADRLSIYGLLVVINVWSSCAASANGVGIEMRIPLSDSEGIVVQRLLGEQRDRTQGALFLTHKPLIFDSRVIRIESPRTCHGDHCKTVLVNFQTLEIVDIGFARSVFLASNFFIPNIKSRDIVTVSKLCGKSGYSINQNNEFGRPVFECENEK